MEKKYYIQFEKDEDRESFVRRLTRSKHRSTCIDYAPDKASARQSIAVTGSRNSGDFSTRYSETRPHSVPASHTVNYASGLAKAQDFNAEDALMSRVKRLKSEIDLVDIFVGSWNVGDAPPSVIHLADPLPLDARDMIRNTHSIECVNSDSDSESEKGFEDHSERDIFEALRSWMFEKRRQEFKKDEDSFDSMHSTDYPKADVYAIGLQECVHPEEWKNALFR